MQERKRNKANQVSNDQPMERFLLTCVEAANVINDPKCNKGPRCNNIIICVIGFSPECN